MSYLRGEEIFEDGWRVLQAPGSTTKRRNEAKTSRSVRLRLLRAKWHMAGIRRRPSNYGNYRSENAEIEFQPLSRII